MNSFFFHAMLFAKENGNAVIAMWAESFWGLL